MRDGTTTIEGIFFTRKAEVGLAIVFGNAFECISRDGDPVFFDVLGE
jgi:hypothetical protein